MVQVIKTGNPQGKLAEQLGMSLGQGLGSGLNTYFANRSLDSVMKDKSLESASPSRRLEAVRAALSPYGEKGQEIFQQRMMLEQQEQQEKQIAKQEAMQKVKGRAIGKLHKGEELSEEEWSRFTPQEVAALRKAYHPKPAGGVTAQPTPPEVANKIQTVLQNKPKANADELRLEMDLQGIPSVFSNPYIENRRQQGIQNIEQFKGERDFHTKRAYPVVQEAEDIIKTHPIKKGLLDQQRRDISTGNVEGFPQFMADKLNLEIYRNPEAARFKNISKNRFVESLSELGGAGARPNQFIEQQLTQAQPAIGRSALANQTVLDLEEFIEDMKLQRAKYVEQLAAEDFEKYGYERGDINSRANKLMEGYADKRQDEMAYDIRRRTEDEMDNETLTRDIVGKRVPNDTPLTLRTARILMIKNNDDEKKAFEEAKRLGFKIPLDSTYQRSAQ